MNEVSDRAVAPRLDLAGCTVLCVDDEPNILAALRRALRPLGCRMLDAKDGPDALQRLAQTPVDLVISDMRMPGMNGAELLEQVAAAWPASIRILLTGHADMGSTIEAINRGRIFRYLTKPWNDDDLRATVRQGLELLALQRDRERLEALTQAQNQQLLEANALLERRVAVRTADLSAAHEKLKRSWMTSIKVFGGLIELRAGRLAGHGRRVADSARKLAQAMGCSAEEVQQVFVAALLHDIGLIGMPDTALAKPVARYTPEEMAQMHRHPVIGEQSLMPLDEMPPVAALIRAHHERHDGEGFPDRRAGADIPLGARILAVADAFDDMQNGHLADAMLTVAEARTLLRHGRGRQFDPEVVDVFLHMTEPERPVLLADIAIGSSDLEAGMVLSRDLVSTAGVLMLNAGHVLNAALIERIQAFEQREGGRLVLHIKPRSG